MHRSYCILCEIRGVIKKSWTSYEMWHEIKTTHNNTNQVFFLNIVSLLVTLVVHYIQNECIRSQT